MTISILSTALYLLSALTIWLQRDGRFSLGLLLTGTLLAFAGGHVGLVGLFLLLITATLALSSNFYLKLGAALLSFLIALHWLPGFVGFFPFGPVRFSTDSTLYQFRFNFDKCAIGVLLLIAWHPITRSKAGWFSVAKSVALFLPVTVAILIGPALALGHVRPDLKVPAETWLFITKNLFFVVIAEEVLFRGVLQRELTRLIPFIPALLLSSFLFGLYHYREGPIMIGLSSVAGVLYGLAYSYSGEKIEAAMLTHVGLNTVHLLFFTYPALAHPH